jgi:hypothetical protein
MSNPLFPNFDREVQRLALEEWRRSEAGKLVSAAQRGGLRSAQGVRSARKLMRMAKAGGPARYGRLSDWIKKTVFAEMHKAFGPLAGVIEAMIRPSGSSMVADFDRELQAAANLLTAFGYGVTPPATKGKPLPKGRPGGPPLPPKPPGQRPTAPPPQEPPELPDEAPGTRRVGGRQFEFAPDDPILTGQMIAVSSSNVHSIGYVWNDAEPMKGTLKVRFLGNGAGGKKTGKGPLYNYYGVHPAVFIAFQNAASKGKFVWDRLRVRGTVSGHQFRYDLAGLGEGRYVPRKATRLGPNEYFLKREVRTRDGRTHTSHLQDELVQRLGTNRLPPKHIAGRGMPQRGTPNRGTPGRGR